MEKDYLNINQKLWDNKTKIHVESKFYDVEAFKKGKNSLNPIELELLGDVKEKSILHLQCHFGLDTMSLSRLGAKVTGVDLSPVAIAEANKLKNELNLDTKFIISDVYSIDEKLNSKFDVIYTSYGVIGWLPDLQKWAKLISHFLKPGGKLILIEFHPVVWMFSSDFTKIEYAYFNEETIIENSIGTYTDPNAPIEDQSVNWNHGLSEVFQALLNNGLHIDHFEEYNHSPYDCFQNTIKISEGKYQIKGLENKLPMLYSVVAQKK
jgi:2-polyprenyl-3-methyl-5-hydroxy-6-metoxy-1,4-benzoquinol methylase